MRTTEKGINTGTIALVGFVSTILTFVIIVGLMGLYNTVESKEYQKKIVERMPDDLRRLRSEQQAAINTYRWVDEQNKVAAIPIDRAMELLAAELSANTAGQPEFSDAP